MGPHETKYLCTAKDAPTEMKKQPKKWGEKSSPAIHWQWDSLYTAQWILKSKHQEHK